EVDDFLDEVVATLRVVTGENEELRAKLEAAEARIAELSSGAPAVQDTATISPPMAPEGGGEQVASPESTSPTDPGSVSPPYPGPDQTGGTATPATGVTGAEGAEPESATGMLQLAQRLHDEYVANGKVEAERILNEAHAEGERVVAEAEEQRTRTLNQLEG